MNIIEQRHSVRQYKNTAIEEEKRAELVSLIDRCNAEYGLNIQIFFDEPNCFNSRKAHYGSFKNVSNYIDLIGTKSSDLDEKTGYCGEMLVLKAQELGLNTCWVALTHGKSAAKIEKGEKSTCIISLGYGETQGTERKSKSIADVCNCADDMPDWFEKGIKAALLAPTAINQQKFYFTLSGDTVTAKAKGIGPCTKIDLGIVKYHFERASGHKVL